MAGQDDTSGETRAPDGVACAVCGGHFPRAEVRPWVAVRPGVSALIAADHPGWVRGSFICDADHAAYRRAYVETMLADERGELSALDRQVADSLAAGTIVAQDPSERPLATTLGERLADRVASFGGSWAFIISFGIVLVVWMAVNVTGLLRQPFDPYPFILLNLVLSTLAAIQAPLIMMSQRRQEERDRQRAENDYRVNLKAELEIRQLHEKIDHQIARQWERLAELQQIQIELLEDRGNGRR